MLSCATQPLMRSAAAAWVGAALALLLLALPAAGDDPPRPLARVATSAAGLSVEPLVEYSSGTLVVAGSRGVVARHELPAGEAIFLRPVGGDGRPLAEGWYRWELRLVRALEPETAEALAAAERAGDEATYRRLVDSVGGLTVRASGRFLVQGGALRVETEPPSAAAKPAPSGDAARPDGEPQAALTEPDEVKITGADPQLVLEDTTTGDDDFRIEAEADELKIENFENTGSPIRIVGIDAAAGADSIYVAPGDSIGLFTATPGTDVELHVVAGDGVPELRLEDSGGTPQAWDLRVLTNAFQIQDDTALFPLTGGVLEIDRTSDTFGGATYDITLRADTTIEGDVALGSSRALKTGFEAVSGAELVAALERLPISTWSYKQDAAGARHLGPVAEEFHSLFGLGRDDKHISPADTAGLALAVAQELAARLRRREERIAALEERLALLERRLEEAVSDAAEAGTEQTPAAPKVEK